MAEKSKERPFESSHGKLDLDGGGFVRYVIKRNSEMMKPISLTFTAYNQDGTPTNSLETDSTLYFDAIGNVVDRAPINTHTNAAKLKIMYSSKLSEHLNKFGDDTAQERALIAGFLLEGENGINRKTALVRGNVERMLVREDT